MASVPVADVGSELNFLCDFFSKEEGHESNACLCHKGREADSCSHVFSCPFEYVLLGALIN